jgi:hypothetical protein
VDTGTLNSWLADKADAGPTGLVVVPAAPGIAASSGGVWPSGLKQLAFKKPWNMKI